MRRAGPAWGSGAAAQHADRAGTGRHRRRASNRLRRCEVGRQGFCFPARRARPAASACVPHRAGLVPASLCQPAPVWRRAHLAGHRRAGRPVHFAAGTAASEPCRHGPRADGRRAYLAHGGRGPAVGRLCRAGRPHPHCCPGRHCAEQGRAGKGLPSTSLQCRPGLPRAGQAQGLRPFPVAQTHTGGALRETAVKHERGWTPLLSGSAVLDQLLPHAAADAGRRPHHRQQRLTGGSQHGRRSAAQGACRPQRFEPQQAAAQGIPAQALDSFH